jgi:hypothetical protein
MKNQSSGHWIAIIVALIGLLGVIVTALIARESGERAAVEIAIAATITAEAKQIDPKIIVVSSEATQTPTQTAIPPTEIFSQVLTSTPEPPTNTPISISTDTQSPSSTETYTVTPLPTSKPRATAAPTTAPTSEKSFFVVLKEEPITWMEANEEAQSLGGHLATITSPEEQELVWKLVSQEPKSWIFNTAGYYIGPWLGGYQPPGSQEPDEGWQWVTGESFSYSAWSGDQPNNSSGIEDALVFMGFGMKSPDWNDYPSAPSGQEWQAEIRAFVVEK